MYGIKTLGFPGILAPTYQLLQADRNEMFETSFTCSTQSSSYLFIGSIVWAPMSLKWPMQSTIQSTCCSIDWIILAKTEGLPGPVIMKKLGNIAVESPK